MSMEMTIRDRRVRRMYYRKWFLLAFTVYISAIGWVSADDLDKLKVQREPVFEFVQKPLVTQKGDKATITFETKGFCDVTVVVDHKDGKIIRHLASGVLGPNAPRPFTPDSKKQTIIWDGKNDFGRYVDDKAACRVRVSLGLKPQFEKTLFWAHKRRQATHPQLVCAAKEGVYVYDGGQTMDHVRLFDHKGNYVRTVYPFSANRLKDVKGLTWRTFEQDSARFPLKKTRMQCTFLTSGYVHPKSDHWNMHSTAAYAMAVRNGRIALTQQRLNRLATDGSTDGMPLEGPDTFLAVPNDRKKVNVWPHSAALSPDGKQLYLTGYLFGRQGGGCNNLKWLTNWRCVPVVMRLDFETGKKMEIWKGRVALHDKPSSGQFSTPVSVTVDTKGRVYVADYIKDRVFIFSSGGKPLKDIKVDGPAQVCVHPETGGIYVFSYKVASVFEPEGRKNVLHLFESFENPVKKESWPLPGEAYGNAQIKYRKTGMRYRAEMDFWTDPLTIWLSEEGSRLNHFTYGKYNTGELDFGNIQILRLSKGKLHRIRSFGLDVAKAGFPPLPAPHHRQRLYVNPADGCCYVAEADWTAMGKSFARLNRIDPETGRVDGVALPFNAEDMCFDLKGMAYLRTINAVVRYDAATWREVPWDYGEEQQGVGFGWMSGTRRTNVISAVTVPGGGCWHQGGMHVSPKGNLVIANIFVVKMAMRTSRKYKGRGKKYKPMIYPGRGGSSLIHVFDKHGKIVYKDAVPGMADLYGVALDRDDNIYAMSSGTRIYSGRRYYNNMTGTLMKLRPKKSRVLVKGSGKVPIPLHKSQYPDRPPDVVSALQGGEAWVENVEWFYGGVGFSGKNPGNGCSCWNARFVLDYLRRSFAPEVDRYSVAVLDTAGNLITRIGTYGNVDDGKPLVEKGGPPAPRAIGSDEVALFHAPYLATHTDHRLFIADPGNARILSVKLNYYTSHAAPLKNNDRKGE